MMMEVTFDSLPFLVSESQREELAHYRELAVHREQEMARHRRLKSLALREYVTRRLIEMEIKGVRKQYLSPFGSGRSSKSITSLCSTVVPKNENMPDQTEGSTQISFSNQHPASPRETPPTALTNHGPHRYSPGAHGHTKVSLTAVWPTYAQQSSWAPIVPSSIEHQQPSLKYTSAATVISTEADTLLTDTTAPLAVDKLVPMIKSHPPPAACSLTHAAATPASNIVIDQPLAPSRPFPAAVATQLVARWSPPTISHHPPFRHTQDQVQKERAMLAAIVRGFLTRRMLDSEKIRNIVTTIKDAENVLQSLDNPATPQDFDLQQRVVSQLQTSKMRLHHIFFSLSAKEQMAYITHSRLLRQERKRKRQADDKKGRLSAATVKALERRRRTTTPSVRDTRHESKAGVPASSDKRVSSLASTSARHTHSQVPPKIHPQTAPHALSKTHSKRDHSLVSYPQAAINPAKPKQETGKKTKRQLPVIKQQKQKVKQPTRKEGHLSPSMTPVVKGTRIPVLQHPKKQPQAASVSSRSASCIDTRPTSSKLARTHSTHKKSRYS